MSDTPKRTPMHRWHTSVGAAMGEFAGYEMPLWYSSAKNEHLAVLTRAGLFDTSHMTVVKIEGDHAHDLLQHCFTNDLDACIGSHRAPLYPGRCTYGAFLDNDGEVIDDGIVFKFSDRRYMVVVNAGMGGIVASHLNTHSGQWRVGVTDLTDRLGKIDVQGPRAAKILSPLLADGHNVFDHMPYFSFKGHLDDTASAGTAVRLKNGTSLLISRTGYTGEFGFELFLSADRALDVWKAIQRDD